VRLTPPSVAELRRVARWLAGRAAKRRDHEGQPLKPMRRKSFSSRQKRFIAYDLETTRIAKGTPTPLYITAYGEDFNFSRRLASLDDLADVLSTDFLTAEMNGMRYVAWNGNHFDSYLVGCALMQVEGIEVIPYLAKGSMLRGFKAVSKHAKLSWEFLDGIAMCMPAQPVPLKEFIEKFAPEFPKLSGNIDFKKEEFDADNPKHIIYAERDSEGLWHAMMAFQKILLDTFGMSLQTTLGNAGIKIFQAEMPDGVNVWSPPFRAEMALREYAYRGGYCHLQRRYRGPTWKYDLNQAYCAAMREVDLPAGRCFEVADYRPDKCGIYRIVAKNSANVIPFYYKTNPHLGEYGLTDLTDTWVTSLEMDQLIREQWAIRIIEGYAWEDAFRMTEFVGKLEKLRMSAPDGPGGALGTAMKNLANSSYGKTCEKLDGLEFRFAFDRPDGFSRSIPGDDEEALPFLWYRIKKPLLRPYHQPQIGAFITAHVRMVVRRAALLAPDEFIYADTDCCAFSSAVSLPFDAKVYGMWKIEKSGERAAWITKKVYFFEDDFEKARKAKGMNVENLTFEDFTNWWEGRPPKQIQVQRSSFTKVMTGGPMFFERPKVGQKLENQHLIN